jgi:hypothetical protein
MALTFTKSLPATYAINQNSNITLSVEVSSDDPSVARVGFSWENPAISSSGNATGTHPYYTTSLNFPAYTQEITGIISVTLIEYDENDAPLNSGVTAQTNITVYEEGQVIEPLFNGRTLSEHQRLHLLGHI